MVCSFIASRKGPENLWFSGLFGWDKRNRTADLLNAIDFAVDGNMEIIRNNGHNGRKTPLFDEKYFHCVHCVSMWFGYSLGKKFRPSQF